MHDPSCADYEREERDEQGEEVDLGAQAALLRLAVVITSSFRALFRDHDALALANEDDQDEKQERQKRRVAV